MTSADFESHSLSGAYAVDALDELELARFEQHLANCEACRVEVASLREAAALLAVDTAEEPPADLEQRILSGIRQIRPLPPVHPEALGRTPARERFRGLLVAAAAVVLLVVGGLAWHPWQQPSTSLAGQVIAAADAQRHLVSLPTGGSVTVVDSASLGRAAIVMSNVAQPPRGHVYELWLAGPSGHMRPAGLVRSGGSGTAVFTGSATRATAAAMTVEPAGGVPQPTTRPVVLVRLKAHA